MLCQRPASKLRVILVYDFALNAVTTEVNPALHTTDAPEVDQVYTQDPSNYSSSPAAAAPAESQLPSYDFMDQLAYDPAADTVAAGNATSSRLRLAAPAPAAQSAHMAQAYQQTVPQAYLRDETSTATGSNAAAAATTSADATLQGHLITQPVAPPPSPAAAADRSVAAATPPASSTYPSYMVSRPAARGTEQDDTWTVASQYSDTQQMAAARLAAVTAPPRPDSQSSVLQQVPGLSPASSINSTQAPRQEWNYQQQPNWFQSQQQQPTTSPAEGASDGSSGIQSASSSPRRACDGGIQVRVTGSRFKCKYKKAEPELSAIPAGPLKVASGQYTYTNGVAV